MVIKVILYLNFIYLKIIIQQLYVKQFHQLIKFTFIIHHSANSFFISKHLTFFFYLFHLLFKYLLILQFINQELHILNHQQDLNYKNYHLGYLYNFNCNVKCKLYKILDLRILPKKLVQSNLYYLYIFINLYLCNQLIIIYFQNLYLILK